MAQLAGPSSQTGIEVHHQLQMQGLGFQLFFGINANRTWDNEIFQTNFIENMTGFL
jgi:hypothetical protein